jgi:hypothetical protein
LTFPHADNEETRANEVAGQPYCRSTGHGCIQFILNLYRMKHAPLIGMAFLGVALFACSKDESARGLKTTSLDDTTWRMTGYTMDFGPLNRAATSTNNFFVSYSNDPTKPPCLGLNTFRFTAAGKVLWTQEARGCSVTGNFAGSDWGTWSANNAGTQLTINRPQGAGQSAMPVVFAVQGAYDYTLSATALTLTSRHIYGRNQDSLRVDRAVFTRQ